MTLYCSLSCCKEKDARSWFDRLYDKLAQLLDNGFEVSNWPEVTRFWNSSCCFALSQRFGKASLLSIVIVREQVIWDAVRAYKSKREASSAHV